jgi:hypothetical protein
MYFYGRALLNLAQFGVPMPSEAGRLDLRSADAGKLNLLAANRDQLRLRTVCGR